MKDQALSDFFHLPYSSTAPQQNMKVHLLRKIVIAELIQGAKSEREISVIEDFVDYLPINSQTCHLTPIALRLAHNLEDPIT